MRDPARIQKILAQIERIWVAHPDMRLGQLLVNFTETNKFEEAPFFYEDDKLLADLESADLNPHPALKAIESEDFK